MSDDLEKRLRDLTGMAHSDFTIGEEAADELARLRSEIGKYSMSSPFYNWQQEIDGLRSDNEALRHDIERQVQAASELAGECARLREAIKAHNTGCESECKWRYEHQLCAFRNPDGSHRYGDKRCGYCPTDYAIETLKGAAK